MQADSAALSVQESPTENHLIHLVEEQLAAHLLVLAEAFGVAVKEKFSTYNLCTSSLPASGRRYRRISYRFAQIFTSEELG